ncbi:MAG: pyruvate formate lyase family protein [Kiritimatiellia bacterium]
MNAVEDRKEKGKALGAPAGLSLRTHRFLEQARRRAEQAVLGSSPKQRNWTEAFFENFKDEPAVRRRQALSFAHALRNEPVVLHDEQFLVGQIYQTIPGSGDCETSGTGFDSRWNEFEFVTAFGRRVRDELPELLPLNGHAEGTNDPAAWLTDAPNFPGHIGWHYDWILKDGIAGLLERLAVARPGVDAEGGEFLDGMRIVLEALLAWNDRHVAEMERRLPEIAGAFRDEWRQQIAICKQVPRRGARNFREALQSFHLTYLATIFEAPNGGNGPGRLDYYLWPYLESDLADGTETPGSVRELIDELFIRFHERLGFRADGWVETVVVGGCHPNGECAVTPLSRIMIESIGALKISHPSVYIRMPENAPDEWWEVAVRDLREGGNRAQVVSDQSIIAAMTRNGAIPLSDARMYMCGGCMEISPHGMNGDLLFTGFFNTAKVLELVINGGVCMNTGKRLLPEWRRTLADFGTFEELYAAFEEELGRILTLTFRSMDIASEEYARRRPRFLVSSQVDDCIARGRGINDGGARYEDYGSTPLGIPNIGDALFAIQQAVFVERFVSAAELLAALRQDFAGDEQLHARLLALPKFGQGNAAADVMTNRVLRSVCGRYESHRNRFGRSIKPMIMTFWMAPVAGRALGATADGRRAGKPITQGLTPQSMAMNAGLTTAIRSANSLDLELFPGGASSMWDLAPEFATPEILNGILRAFLATGGQMYQGNTTDVATLVKARKNPDEYRHLMVRIGGYSGQFVACAPEVQDELINRRRHQER